MGPSWSELVRVGHEKDLLIYFFSVVGQEFCQFPLVALVVWDLSQHVLHPGSWGNIGSLAGAYVRIYDCCTISRCIIDMTGEVLEEEGVRVHFSAL